MFCQLTRLCPRLPRVPLHRHHFMGRGELPEPCGAGGAAVAAGEPVPGLRGLDGVSLRRREDARRGARLRLSWDGGAPPSSGDMVPIQDCLEELADDVVVRRNSTVLPDIAVQRGFAAVRVGHCPEKAFFEGGTFSVL